MNTELYNEIAAHAAMMDCASRSRRSRCYWQQLAEIQKSLGNYFAIETTERGDTARVIGMDDGDFIIITGMIQ